MVERCDALAEIAQPRNKVFAHSAGGVRLPLLAPSVSVGPAAGCRVSRKSGRGALIVTQDDERWRELPLSLGRRLTALAGWAWLWL